MADISKIKTPDNELHTIKDGSAVASITRSGTTFTATRRDGTEFTFTQQDNNTTYTFATGDNNGQIKVTPSGGTAQNVSVKGLGAAAYKGTTTSVTSGSSDLVTSGAVYTAIDNLPEPMIFKGSLGTGGTITTLPTASSANEGFTYKVITAGTYASQVAKVGDLFISNGTDWIWIPSGDEPSGTVTSVAIANGGGLSVSGSPITSSGTITISHADTSSQASVDNSGRTYIQDITLDTYGHVTKITSATETVVNTDRYVNSVAFANDTSGVKMTLTRAGSDTATVTGTIPLVSSSTAGVAPKGTAVSSQSQSTKFLREDGSWAAPSYTTNTNTTYTLSVGTGDDANKIVLTPSSGTANKITVPYATSAGSATSAGKLGSSNVGSATQPIYLNAGTATACTYTLGKSVPSDAVFTDHTYNFSGTTFYSGNSGNAEHNCNNAIKNGVYYYTSNGAATSIGASTNDGALYVQSYSDSWVGQICQDYRNGNLFTRGKNNGTWSDWRKVMYSNDTYSGTLTKSQVTTALGYTPPTSDTNTHRPIQVNGTEILGNNTTALNLKAGSNVWVTNTNGTVTIEATDTNTTYTLSADTTNNKIKLTPSSGFTQSITVPYASSAGSAGRVSISTANPETDTYYMPIFGYGTGDTPILYKHSNDYTYYLRKGTTSRIGESALILGNGVSSGTDDNSRGELVLYSEGSVSSILMMTNTNIGSAYKHYLPAVAGTIGVFTVTPTSGQVVVTDGTAGGFKTTGYTIAKSVPSDAVFTDHYAWTDITGKPSSFTPASHTHGNIQNGGTLQTNDITIASGDKLVVTDSSDSSKVARTSISFDGSTTTKCLTQKGTWVTFGTSNLTLGTTASTALKGDTKYAGASTAGGSATSAAKLDTSTAGSATKPCYFVNGVPSACTYSLNKTVPSDAVFTDTNNAVTQTATTTSANYELLFSATADNTTRTEGARKTDSLKYNPSTKEMTLDGTIVLNGYSRATSTDPCPSIVLKANNIDTDTAVSARTYGDSEINVHDKDGDRLGFINWFKDADGSIGFTFAAQNKSTDGNNQYNTFDMRVDKTGNRSYSITDAKAFRTAINTTTCSFTKSISSLAGATIVRRGNVVTLEFGHQITSAGSYTNIGTVSPAPIQTLHFVVNCGGSWQLARINTNGVVSFNNPLSVAANAYLIGSCTYITAD